MIRSTFAFVAVICLLQNFGVQSATPYSSPSMEQLIQHNRFGLKSCLDWEVAEVYQEDQFKDAVLDLHIGVREEHNDRVVEEGCSGAQVSTTMTWDSDLAKLAQLWANHCALGHGYSKVHCDYTLSNPYTFWANDSYHQNYMWNLGTSWDMALSNMVAPNGMVHFWEGAHVNYDPCNGNCTVGKECSMYTNMVDPAVTKVGCAYTDECHKCTKLYAQDDTHLFVEDNAFNAWMWFPDTAMYVCLYN